MPVTARLSQRFYERFGDELTNELVDWFNAVDATYRSDLKELNELNFARFDAKVDQRFAESDAKWERRFSEFRIEIEQRLALQERRLIGWMFAFWTGTIIPLAGLFWAVLSAR